MQNKPNFKLSKMKFVLSGDLKIGARKMPFKKEVEAKDEKEAKELTYSLFGSEHGTKRRHINIEKVEKGG